MSQTVQYTDPASGRRILIEIIRLEGRRSSYAYRLWSGVPGEVLSEVFPFYLDALKAGLEAARTLCQKPPH